MRHQHDGEQPGHDQHSGTKIVHTSRRPLITPFRWIQYVLVFTIVYAACFTVIKAGLAYAPPLRFAGLRALLGGAVLLIVVQVYHQPVLPDYRRWLMLLGLALTSTTMTFGGMFLSPGRTGAGIASVLGNTQPLFAIVLATIYLEERLSRDKLVALVLGFAGAALIAYPAWAGAAEFSLTGATLALASAGGAASGSVLLKRMNPHHLLATAGWQLILGSLPLFAASAAIERGQSVNWSIAFVGLLLFLALIGTSFATALWYWLVQRAEVGRLSLFLFLTPVVGLGIAAAVFGERLGSIEVLGIVLTMAGIGMSVWEVWHSRSRSSSHHGT